MEYIIHVVQPPNSSTCGQCCVAMVLNVPVERVIKEIGRGGTNYTKLRRAVENITRSKIARPRATLSPPYQRRRSIIDHPRTGTWIVKIQWSKKPHRSHFVVLSNDIVYDPSYGQKMKFTEWLDTYRSITHQPNLHISSWAEVVPLKRRKK